MTEFWQDISTGFSLALVAYAATNVDNFVALLGLTARGTPARSIVLGFSLSAVSVLALSTLFTLLSYAIAPGFLRYLGFVPMAIGLRLLANVNDEGTVPAPAQVTAASVFAFLAVSSMDTIATFGPLLAESEPAVRLSIILGYLAMASVMIRAVLKASHAASRVLGDRRSMRYLAPAIMIAVGVYILLNTGTDLEPGP